ncbi:MAG: serine/threonine-protein kinase [Myxococcota bacterium]
MFIGRYETVHDIGRGGMAKVVLARAPNGRHVVLKVTLTDDEDAAARLRDEARTGMRLAHPNIVETLDLFEHEGRPVLVLSFVSGSSLYALRERGPLPPGVVVRMGRQLCEALDAIHNAADERGQPLKILHRDVTAANVMLGDDGEARLIDLGIARSVESLAARTQTGCMRGTLRYLAPELFQGHKFSAASDLWSLGIVLLEAAIGRAAFPGRTDAEIILSIVQGDPFTQCTQSPIDVRLRTVLAKLLAKDPAARAVSARDAARSFLDAEQHFPLAPEEARRFVQGALPVTQGNPEAHRLSTESLIDQAFRTFGAREVSVESDAYELIDEVPPTLTQTSSVTFLGSGPGVPPDAAKAAILAYAQRLRAFEFERPPPLRPDESGELLI